MAFIIETTKINELLGTDYKGDNHAYGVPYSTFELTDLDSFDDFLENAEAGEYFEDSEGFDYVKAYNSQRDVVVFSVDPETNIFKLI